MYYNCNHVPNDYIKSTEYEKRKTTPRIPYVDQGLSLTLFFYGTGTNRDLNKAQIYAWRKGIKTLYYIRIRQQALSGTEVQGCVSCML